MDAALILKIVIVVAVVILVIFLLLLITSIRSAKPHDGSIWHDRKRTIFGLPLSFTVYDLDDERLFIQTGFVKLNEEDIRLYRVLDISYSASLGQRIFGVGSITLSTSDKTAGRIDIQSVKDARKIKELIAKNVEEQRDKKRVLNREMMIDNSDNEDLM